MLRQSLVYQICLRIHSHKEKEKKTGMGREKSNCSAGPHAVIYQVGCLEQTVLVRVALQLDNFCTQICSGTGFGLSRQGRVLSEGALSV